jgi:hypothetical protein
MLSEHYVEMLADYYTHPNLGFDLSDFRCVIGADLAQIVRQPPLLDEPHAEGMDSSFSSPWYSAFATGPAVGWG